MRRRGGAGSIAANPVLIGAVTVLVVIVAVYLAYNANSGLPFVPTYDLKAEVPNAAGLVKGNDVRVGGTRVGTVSCIEPQTQPSGEVIAVLCLKLETVVKPLPADTRVLIRPRSALGLKYVQLTRGDSTEDLAANSTIPLRQALPEPVELDEFFDMFPERTRRAIQGNLTNFGAGFASRGADLNFTIRDLNPLLDDLEPVMRNLASAETDLKGFWDGLAQSAAVVAPVAEVQGEMYANLDTTFSALADVARPVHQGDDRRGPADAAHGDPHPADHPAVPRQLGRALHRVPARLRELRRGVARPRRRGPRRHARAGGLARVQRAACHDVQGARDLQHRPAGPARLPGPHVDGVDRRPAGRPPSPRPRPPATTSACSSRTSRAR